MRMTIPTLCTADVEIPTGAITDVVNELIGCASVVLIGMFAVLGMGEGEVAFAGRLELDEFVDAVFG